MMGLDENLLEDDGGISNLGRIEGKEAEDGNVSGKGEESDYCNGCLELKDKCKTAEERCTVLELEIEKKRSGVELLEGQLGALRVKNLVIEDEVCLLRRRNKELEDKITHFGNGDKATIVKQGKNVGDFIDLCHLTEDVEEQKVLELMIENNVLNCEKNKAESDVRVWKAKCKELELWILELEKSLSPRCQECTLTGTPKVGWVSPEASVKEISEANDLPDGFCGAATPVVDTVHQNLMRLDVANQDILHENERVYVTRARKQLVFGGEGTYNEMVAPITPAGATPAPVGLIHISHSNDEETGMNLPAHVIQARKKGHCSTDFGVTPTKKELPLENNLTRLFYQSDDDDDVTQCYRGAPSMLTPKRKRASHIVHSDSGSDTDDNLPISRLRREYHHELDVPSLKKSSSRDDGSCEDKEGESVARRHLVTLRKCKEEGTSTKHSHGNLKSIGIKHLRGIPTTGSFTDDESGEGESDSEGESFSSFIVSDSVDDNDSKDDDISGSNERSAGENSSGESEDISDSNMNYDDIISRIGRRKDHVVKWVFEADMLSAFVKDPVLCMKAVCALYRQQTSEEKMSKATIYMNQRGFSQCDATRGSELGEFLTNGDSQGDLQKSVKELQQYDAKGLEQCRKLAMHYSKQLFAMYENKEDPLWPGLETK